MSYRVPTLLTVTNALPRRILVVGSCLVEGWTEVLEDVASDAVSEFVLLNHLGMLPDTPPSDIATYDFQVVQVPLRSVLPEGAYFRLDFSDSAAYQSLFDETVQRLELYLDAAMRWNREHRLLTFVVNFLVPQQNPMGRLLPKYDLRNLAHFVDRLNEQLDELVRSYVSAHVLDVDEICATLGRRYFQDDMVWSGNHASALSDSEYEWDQLRLERPLAVSEYYPVRTREYIAAFWAESIAQWRTIRGTDSIKLVIVDLDDTLWRGVRAEGAPTVGNPIEGWPLGVIEALGYLKRRGMLLAIVSKNSMETVVGQWAELIDDSRLQLVDFAMVRANWQPKADNVEEILAELNLLPKNVLFVDDNPVERHAVQSAFPEIRVLGPNPYEWRRALLWSAETQVPVITAESTVRTEMVKGQIERNAVKKKLSREEFLHDLHLEMSFDLISAVDHGGFARAMELINKTNQFNTTGRRWDLREFGDLFGAGGRLVTFDVQDRFTRYGTVGVIVLSGDTIEQLVMSCRVVGLDAEKMAIFSVVQRLRDDGLQHIHAREIVTESNSLSRNLFRDNGFVATDDGLVLLFETVVYAPTHISIASRHSRIPKAVVK